MQTVTQNNNTMQITSAQGDSIYSVMYILHNDSVALVHAPVIDDQLQNESHILRWN